MTAVFTAVERRGAQVVQQGSHHGDNEVYRREGSHQECSES
jgi:hypothetical protein